MENKIRAFIETNRDKDVKQLALQASRHKDIDFKYALEQISGYQKAKIKLPSWTKLPNIVYPRQLSLEQCSSETTAKYKAKIISRLMPEERNSMVDLTGGMGVDFSFLSPLFSRSTYVEMLNDLCETARKNFPTLGIDAEIVCNDGMKFLETMEPKSLIFIDPARREKSGKKTVLIEDCTPNIAEVSDVLLSKAKLVMVKLSPMLDIVKAMESLSHIAEVHIVATSGECKELLLIMKAEAKSTKIYCINDEEEFVFSQDEEASATAQMAEQIEEYLFEPNVAIMKAGAFKLISERYGIKKLHSNSHLYTHHEDVPQFPGRRFKVEDVFSLNKKEVKTALGDISKANVAVRNFPMKAEELRKRLKLADGGNIFLFGTSMKNERHLVVRCSKIGKK